MSNRLEHGADSGEAYYRALFETVDDGFCVIEIVVDADGRPIDLLYLDVNEAFERHSGLENATGRTLRELVSDAEEEWIERYDAVVRSGRPARFDVHVSALGDRVFDVHAAPLSGERGRLAVLFRDVSDLRRAQESLREGEAHKAYLLDLSDALRRLADPIEIQSEATRILAQGLGGSRSLYVAVDGATFVADRNYHVPGAPRVEGRHRLDDFGARVAAALRAGRTVVDDDVVRSAWLGPEHRAAYAAMGIGAHVTVPLVKEARLVALLSIHAPHARTWTARETSLVEETAERTWAAVERARSEAALREGEEKYRSLFESMAEGFLLMETIVDETGCPVDALFLEANPVAMRMMVADGLPGKLLSEVSEVFEPYWLDILARVARTEESLRVERHAAPAGVWYDLHAFRVGHAETRRVAVVFHDISERKRIEEELRARREELFHLAHHDPLTGLPNRALFGDRLRLAVATAARHDRIVAVLLMDLDGFKAVNDQFGHAAGDRVLAELAQRLRSSLREVDTLARLHGDEFALLLPEIAEPAAALGIAATINAVIAQPVAVGDRFISLSSSIGISLFPSDGDDAEALLRAADVAMYHVKVNGKNGGRIFEPFMSAPAEERVTLGELFGGALARGELQLHYQPQWDSRTGRIVSFEALLRWTSSLLGEVSPTRFVPIAEADDAFGPVVTWSLDQCGAAVRALSGVRGAPVRVALNVTPAHVASEDFPARIAAAIRKHGLEPRQFELELSMRTLYDASAGLAPALARLKGMGVRVTLDHFGADMEMVALLLDLGLDGVKIEPHVIDRASRDPRLRPGVGAMIALVHDLGLEVTAVGVETSGQRDIAVELGCDRLQGYFFGHAMPRVEAQALVERQPVRTLF